MKYLHCIKEFPAAGEKLLLPKDAVLVDSIMYRDSVGTTHCVSPFLFIVADHSIEAVWPDDLHKDPYIRVTYAVGD